MEESRNTIGLENGRVIKQFANHMDYVNELRIYKKLEGTGLCPELLYNGQDVIEHEYIDSPLLFDELIAAISDERKLQHLFALFTAWYAEFRRIAGCSLEHVDFRDFAVKDDHIVCFDFEHCKADFLESDFAKLCSQIYLVPKPFSAEAERVCRLFIRQVCARFSLAPDLFASQLRGELARICELLGIEHDEEKIDGFAERTADLIRESI